MPKTEDVAPASFRLAFRRYWPHATAVGLLTGVFGWWAIGDYVGGIVLSAGLFFAAILTLPVGHTRTGQPGRSRQQR